MAEEKKNILVILISSILFFISTVLISYICLDKVNKKIEIKYLNDIIESNVSQEGEKTYLNIKSISQIFAKDSKNGYYFVTDGEYNYVVYLDEKKANELFKQDLESNPVKMYGITKNATDDIKKIAIEKYNVGYEEEKQITMKDYYSYFGDLYLDLVNVK